MCFQLSIVIVSVDVCLLWVGRIYRALRSTECDVSRMAYLLALHMQLSLAAPTACTSTVDCWSSAITELVAWNVCAVPCCNMWNRKSSSPDGQNSRSQRWLVKQSTRPVSLYCNMRLEYKSQVQKNLIGCKNGGWNRRLCPYLNIWSRSYGRILECGAEQRNRLMGLCNATRITDCRRNSFQRG